MEIKKVPSPNFGSRDNNPIKYIALHIMAGTISSAENTFLNPINEVSSHYGIALNGEVHQYVDDNKAAWGNGGVKSPTAKIVLENLNVNQNKISLSIENEGMDLAKAPEVQLVSLVALIKDLATKYGIPLDREHIIGHREINSVGKPICPSNDNAILDTIVKRCQVVVPPSTVKQLISDIKSKVAQLEIELNK